MSSMSEIVNSMLGGSKQTGTPPELKEETPKAVTLGDVQAEIEKSAKRGGPEVLSPEWADRFRIGTIVQNAARSLKTVRQEDSRRDGGRETITADPFEFKLDTYDHEICCQQITIKTPKGALTVYNSNYDGHKLVAGPWVHSLQWLLEKLESDTKWADVKRTRAHEMKTRRVYEAALEMFGG